MIDQRLDVFDLPIHGVWLGITALTAAAPVEGVDRIVLHEPGDEQCVAQERAVRQGAAHDDECRTLATFGEGDLGAVPGWYASHGCSFVPGVSGSRVCPWCSLGCTC